MAAESIIGIQQQGVIATTKHFSLNCNETNRHWLDAVIDPDAHRESDLLAFEIVIERSQPGAVMAAYNKVNGDYAAGNDHLLNDVLDPAAGVTQLLSGVTNLQAQGTEVIDGISTTKITGTIPASSVKMLDPGAKSARPATVWIAQDGSHHLVRASIDLGSGSIQLTQSKWNEPVNVD